jgi:ABC-2 type transport system permease protein
MTTVLSGLTLAELRLAMRDRIAPVGIALPVVLLIIFGFIPTFRDAQTSFGGYSAFDIYVPIVILMSMALLALGVPAVLTGYREKGVLRRLQATPAGAARVLTAQLLVNLILVVISVMLVLAVARLGYGVALPRQLAGFALSVLLTLAALLGLGLFIAAIAPSTRVSQVIGGLLFYPMLFFSGLWFPIPLMAPALQHVAHATPLGAAWEAMAYSATGHWPPMLPLITLAVYAIALSLAAAKWFRWE